MGQAPEGLQNNMAVQQAMAGVPVGQAHLQAAQATQAPYGQVANPQQHYQQLLAQHLINNGGLYPTTANLQTTHNDAFQRQTPPPAAQAMPAPASARLSQLQAQPQPTPQGLPPEQPKKPQPRPELEALRQTEAWLNDSMGSKVSTLYDPIPFAKKIGSEVGDGNYNNMSPETGAEGKQGFVGWLFNLPNQAWKAVSSLWPFGKKEEAGSFGIS